jgi:hypothetical protein
MPFFRNERRYKPTDGRPPPGKAEISALACVRLMHSMMVFADASNAAQEFIRMMRRIAIPATY